MSGLSIGELIAQLKQQGIAPEGSGTAPYGGETPGTVDPIAIPGIDDIRAGEKETISDYLSKITQGDTNLETRNVFSVAQSLVAGELGTPHVLVDPEGRPHPLGNSENASQSTFIFPNEGADTYTASPDNPTSSGGASPDVAAPELQEAFDTLSRLGFFQDLEGTDGPFLDKNAQTEGHYIVNAPDTREKVTAILSSTRFGGLESNPAAPYSSTIDSHIGFQQDDGTPHESELIDQQNIAGSLQASGFSSTTAISNPLQTYRDIDGNELTNVEARGIAARYDVGPTTPPPFIASGTPIVGGQPITVLGNVLPPDGSQATHGAPHTIWNGFYQGLGAGASDNLRDAFDQMMVILSPSLLQIDQLLGVFTPLTIIDNQPKKPWKLPYGARYGVKSYIDPVVVLPNDGAVISYPGAGIADQPLNILKTLGIPVPRHVMSACAISPTALLQLVTTMVKYGINRVLNTCKQDATSYAHWRILLRRMNQSIGPFNNFGLPIPPPPPSGTSPTSPAYTQYLIGSDLYMQQLSDCAAMRLIRMFAIMSEPHAAGAIVGGTGSAIGPYRFSGFKDLNKRRNAGPQRLSLSRVPAGVFAKPISGLSVKNIPSMMLLPKAFRIGRQDGGRGGGGTQPTAAGPNVSNGLPSLSSNHKTAAGILGTPVRWKNLLQASGVDASLANNANIALRKKLGRPKNGDATRFSREEVNAIENALEAEHMPFYFHDLRTNEVIAFHAFLQSLSDSYSPSFKATSGFGRIEDVQIYEKTTRSISISFIIAAMNPDDMNEMYWKINKLVSMIYPQFSRGTMLEHTGQDATTRFVQPFSQIPTATPVIRLRVGDLIKSNYNRDGIRRLMGAQDPAFAIAEALDPVTTDCDVIVDAIKNIVNTVPIDDVGQYNPDAGGWPVGSHVILDPPYAPTVAMNGSTASSNWQAMITTDNTKFPVEILEYISYDNPLGGVEPYDIVIRVKLLPAGIPNMGTVCGQDGTGLDRIATDISNGDAPITEVMLSYTDIMHDATADLYCINGLNGTHFASTIDTLTAGDTTPAEAAANAAAASDAIKDVLFKDANPIFQSFETTTGRGLAGVISSFDIDWMLNTATWDITPGQRAPTMCTINVGFTPIHDIVPGLDSDGMMRSTNYNIGKASHEIQQDPHGDDTAANSAAATQVDPF